MFDLKTNCYPGSSLKWIVTLRTTRSQSLGSCVGIALKQVQRTKKTHDKLQSCNAWGNVTLLDLLATHAWNLGELLSCWFSSERVRMAKTNAFFRFPSTFWQPQPFEKPCNCGTQAGVLLSALVSRHAGLQHVVLWQNPVVKNELPAPTKNTRPQYAAVGPWTRRSLNACHPWQCRIASCGLYTQSSSEVIKPMHPFQMTLRIKQRKRPRRGFIFEHASQRRWPAQRCKTHAQLQQKCFRQIQNLRHGSFATTVGLFVEKPTLGGITGILQQHARANI